MHQGPLLERNKQNHLICGLGIDGTVSGHHASIVVLAGSHREQKLRIARVIDFPPPVSLTMLRDEIVRWAKHYWTPFIACDPWQLIKTAEELTAAGFKVQCQHQTGNVLTRQAAALLEVFRDGTIELYRGDTGADLLIQDLYSARVVEKSYGHKIELAENEHGHGDRLSALLQILPTCLEARGHPPIQRGPQITRLTTDRNGRLIPTY